MSVGDAPAVNPALGAKHLAVAVGEDALEGLRDLTDLGQAHAEQCLAQTPIAIEPARVVSEEPLDAISVVHVQLIGANRPRVKRSTEALDGGQKYERRVRTSDPSAEILKGTMGADGCDSYSQRVNWFEEPKRGFLPRDTVLKPASLRPPRIIRQRPRQ